MTHDCHEYIGKISNEFEYAYNRYKIFNSSIDTTKITQVFQADHLLY